MTTATRLSASRNYAAASRLRTGPLLIAAVVATVAALAMLAA